uniref:carboxypeptidase N subunit 2-like n=1 Tax=Myxine glutinosa TaxID=7769 RepID=UPI00358F5C22
MTVIPTGPMAKLLFIVILLGPSLVYGCPPKCSCDVKQHTVDCRAKDLYALPWPLPNSTDILLLDENSLSSLAFPSPIPTLTYLGISSNRRPLSLPPAAFKALPNLQFLHMDSSRPTDLPNTVFQGIRLLKWVDLSNCALFEVPEELFQLVPKLNYLDLSKNGLQELPSKVFEGLRYLDTLYLGRNSISYLPDSVFGHLERLELLDLSYNSLQSVPLAVLSQLLSLKDLRLNGNQLTALEPDILKPSILLEKISVSYNNIRRIPPLLFRFNKNLNNVDISYNRLHKLPPGLLRNLTRLQWFYCTYNQIERLDCDTFVGNKELKELRMDGNHLESLPPGLLQNLTQLEEVSFAENKLTSLLANTLAQIGTSVETIANFDLNQLMSLPRDTLEVLATRPCLFMMLKGNPICDDLSSTTERSKVNKQRDAEVMDIVTEGKVDNDTHKRIDDHPGDNSTGPTDSATSTKGDGVKSSSDRLQDEEASSQPLRSIAAEFKNGKIGHSDTSKNTCKAKGIEGGEKKQAGAEKGNKCTSHSALSAEATIRRACLIQQTS